MISLNYRGNLPLHEQISSEFKELIFSGRLKEEEKLPSVRELAVSLTVNPNTVMRAYRDLESEGFICSVQGKGNFVAPKSGTDEVRINELYSEARSCMRELCWRGEGIEKITEIAKKVYEEGE